MIKNKFNNIFSKLPAVFRAHKVVSVMLVVCIVGLTVTGGILAFLTSSDTKSNTFTVGQLSISLYEDDWYDHDTYASNKTIVWLDDDGDEGGASGTANNNIPDFAENLICGQAVSKTPYVQNDSTYGCYIYIAVGIPTLDITSAVADESTINSLQGTSLTVKVNAYGFQQGAMEDEDPTNMWETYTNGHSTFGSKRTNNTRVPMFKLLNIDEDNWELIEQRNTTDNYNWFVYYYKDVLSGRYQTGVIQDPESEIPYYQTTPLFDSVEMIGLDIKTYNVNSGSLYTTGSTTTGGVRYSYYTGLSISNTQHRLNYEDVEDEEGNVTRVYEDFSLTDKATLHFEVDENNVLQAYIYFADGNVLYTSNDGSKNIASGNTTLWKDFDWTSVDFVFSDLWNYSLGSTGPLLGLYSVTNGQYGLMYGLEFNKLKYGDEELTLQFNHTSSGASYGTNHYYRILATGYTNIWDRNYNTYSNSGGWKKVWFGEWLEECLSTGIVVGNFPWLT